MAIDGRACRKNQYECLFKGFLLDNNEKWGFFEIQKNEYPTREQLKEMKGIIFPGAEDCSFDNSLPWLQGLRDFIKMVYDEYPHIKIIGCCFGHQIIAGVLGGKAEKMGVGEVTVIDKE